MCEHVYLCGLTKEQQARMEPAASLSLEKRVGNLVLKLERMRNELTGGETERLTDFIEIASYVFAADRNVGRGSKIDSRMGADWRRTFRLVIAVRDLAFWEGSEVQEALSESLGFLSEDKWTFEFVANLNPIPVQQYLDLKPQDVEEAGGASIILFSGGIDSLAGAVHELVYSNRRVVLVSHQNLRGVGKRQKQLAQKLARVYPKRVTHVSVDNHLTKKIADAEETQRTRSFFFTAIATVAAHIEKADRIRFYENGIMSVNLPLATQVVGARASRSTHPRSLQLLNKLLRLISGDVEFIDNPFIWKTKAEIVSDLVATPFADLITTSASCTHARTVNRQSKPHCGMCVQCLHRRISTLIGGAKEFDEPEGYRVDFLTSPRREGRNRVMAVETVELALSCRDVSEREFLTRFSGPLSLVLQAYPLEEQVAAANNIIDLYRRHGKAVRELLIEATQPNLPGVVDGNLSRDSLLALFLASRLSEFRGVASATLPEKLPEPPATTEPAPRQLDSIYIALDERRQQIVVRDLTTLSGSAIFQIMKLLVDLSFQDRSQPGVPARYRSFLAREIADHLKLTDEESVRSAIRRARRQLEEAFRELGRSVDPQAIIQSTGHGYRLNPGVMVVTTEQIQSL